MDLHTNQSSNAIHFQLPDALPSEIPGHSGHLDHPATTNLPQSSQPFPTPLFDNHSPRTEAAQHPEQQQSSAFAKWWAKWITNWWGVELLCWLIATLALIGIVIALESHRNKPLPEWSFGITLNSLISILATTAQTAMMKPIVECISQLKWLWFVRKEKISGFQAFDDASRGPTGSLALLGKLPGLYLVQLGAAITIVAVAFGPFTQQLVSFPLVLHPTGIAIVPQVFNLTGATDPNGLVNPVMMAAIYEGLGQGNLSLSSVTPICGSGNCTWPPYPSLGVCASVEDVSSTIRNNGCDNNTAFEENFQIAGLTNPGYSCFNYTLPEIVHAATVLNGENLAQISNATLSNGYSAYSSIYDKGFMEVMSLTPTFTNSSSLATAYLMYQPDFLTSINTSLPSPVAYRLNFDICIHTYNTTVLNGAVNTAILSSQILQLEGNTSYYPGNDSFTVNGNSTYVSIGDRVFGATQVSSAVLGLTLQQAFDDVCFDVIPHGSEWSEDAQSNYTDYCSFAFGFSFFNIMVNSTDTFSAISEQLENMAISMTNGFRMGAGGDTQIGDVPGTLLTPLIFVRTNYLWLILPIGLVGLTLVFLVATMLKSQRLGSRIWKSSNLATLQGLHINLHTRLGGLSSISEMEEKVKELKVMFDMKSGVAEKGVEYRLVELKQETYWK